MNPISQATSTPEIINLLQRILRLRNHFKVVPPESIAALRKKIHESKLAGVSAGFEDAGLFFTAGSVIALSEGPITMGELSRELEVPLSTATRTMDWLVNNEYAQRLPDPKDRRVVRVELTENGKATLQAISTFMLARVEQALSPLTPDEREMFIKLLNKVLYAFDQAA
jgi:DNA-binding MarR family transcriptional regulator